MKPSLSFSDLGDSEERLLLSKLDAVRAVLRHGGEKGRSLEKHVTDFLRSFLPAEYGLSTGFVAFHAEEGPEISKQLDIIIYDAVRGAPLARLETCDVFPIESVYGYVEVKTSLCSSSDEAQGRAGNSIEACIEANAHLRTMRKRRYRSVDRSGSPIRYSDDFYPWLAPRGYVFAFEGGDKTALDRTSMSARMSEYSRRLDAHLHGVFIAGVGFLYTVPVDPDRADSADTHRVRCTAAHALQTMKAIMLLQLSSFPRPPEGWSVSLDSYNDYLPVWEDFGCEGNDEMPLASDGLPEPCD